VRAAGIGRQLSELPPARTRVVLTALIERVEVRVDHVDIHLRPRGLGVLFDVAAASQSILDGQIQLASAPDRRARLDRRCHSGAARSVDLP
jgi:hypothetical protein